MAIWAGVGEHSDGHSSHTKGRKEETDSTHQAQKQLSERTCCLCAWQIEKARKADQFLPLLVLIGTLSHRNKSLRSSGLLKAV